jgi:hypothetical protein
VGFIALRESLIIEGVLEAPSGASPRIRTVWILETGETHPRFVTAYPA